MDALTDSYRSNSLWLSNGLRIANKSYRSPARMYQFNPYGGTQETSTFVSLQHVHVEIWLEILGWVIGDRAGVVYDMNTGSVGCTDPDLLSISVTSRFFRELSTMVHISHRIILRYSSWDEWKRATPNYELDDWDSPIPEQRLEDMRRELDLCLQLSGNKALDMKVLLYQDYFFSGFDTRLFDYLLTRPSCWGSVTLVAPRARHGWNQVINLADRLWHLTHWTELRDMQIAAGTGRENDFHELPLLIQRIGFAYQLRSLDFGFDMGNCYDWSQHLTSLVLDLGIWGQLRQLHLKHSSSAALLWLLRACRRVEVVYAGLTVDMALTWEPPKVVQHLALQQFGVLMITPGTDAFDLHMVFDGLCCPRLSVMSIGCAPGLGVGLQDDRLAKSVVDFMDRSRCVLTAGCIHSLDVNIMWEDWEDRFRERGLKCHGPPDIFDRKQVAYCFENFWGPDIEDWYWGVPCTEKDLNRTW
ncbi:hypothetical protein AAF712_015545 [Marasmius tenuissimus]|uniref:Uncharacterized protein n=1 Tax=Marasmius tenuissimus TaxID=585030 RepID=A0ABR2Z982_9AGAR